ncbi:MAG: aldolase/citrate lyase family protein [Acidobacteriaceae bacterium]
MTFSAEVKLTRAGEGGRSGKEVRSDVRVLLEPRPSGGIQLELVSRVDLYYGETIRKQALAVLGELGIEHARVLIEDSGALPFVIAARIEAAARRADLSATRQALPERVVLPGPSSKDRLRRTRLYLPGSEPKYFVNAALYKPDAIILDLEDSVHFAEKDSARILVRNALRAVDFGAAERMVRINQLPLGVEDMEEVVPEAPDLLLLPKTETPEQVVEADRRISEISAREGIERPIWLMPILESALGIENAFAIASASERICAMTIGLEDYTSDLGVIKTPEGQESLYARLRLVNAAKAAGVQAIDSVYADIGNLEGLARWGEQSRALGFEGMGCVHPSQIGVVERAFAPSEVEVEKALKIVAAFEEAQAKGLGVVSLGAKMIDAPIVIRARKLVERARQMGIVAVANAAAPAGANAGNQEAKQ